MFMNDIHFCQKSPGWKFIAGVRTLQCPWSLLHALSKVSIDILLLLLTHLKPNKWHLSAHNMWISWMLQAWHDFPAAVAIPSPHPSFWKPFYSIHHLLGLSYFLTLPVSHIDLGFEECCMVGIGRHTLIKCSFVTKPCALLGANFI